MEPMENMPCRNILGQICVNQFLVESDTVTTFEHQKTPVQMMKFSVSPVFGIVSGAKHLSDLSKLVEGLKGLVTLDPTVQCIISGEENSTLEEDHACIPMDIQTQ